MPLLQNMEEAIVVGEKETEQSSAVVRRVDMWEGMGEKYEKVNKRRFEKTVLR